MTLHEKIISLVPEIVELKFGCRVTMEFQGSHGTRTKSQVTIAQRWEGSDETWYRIIGSEINYEAHDFLEIIGRPITLADVLRAIGQQYGDSRLMVNNLGGFRIYYSGDVMPGWEDIGSPRWNLSQNLDGQSDETKAFISKILGV